MLGMALTIAFISTSDPAKALAFYRDTLGLKLQEESGYALVYKVKNTMLSLKQF